MYRKLFSFYLGAMLFCLCFIFLALPAGAEAIIADHNGVGEFESIPDSVIQAIGSDYLIFYGHTSHGSQIVTGINLLYNEDPFYDPPPFHEYGDDLGHNGDTSWVSPTRSWLDAHPEYNMVMWSWCGGCSDNTEEGINIYLNAMNGLEQDYPGVTFIYMTGHLDGGGPEGNLYLRNNQIRDYCINNDKILFDFADIESYDPDGIYYPDASDACEWCYDWCAIYPCPDCGCAHSHCFNCYLKGKAWWWMMARIGGWNLEQDSIPHIISISPAQNELNISVSTNISVTFDITMDETTINDSTFVVTSRSMGFHEGTITYNSGTRTVTFDPNENFDEGEVVTVVLTTNIQSAEELPLDSGYVWSFTVETEGGGCFISDSLYPVSGWPESIFAADLDGDGDIDLITANQGSDDISVLLNNGVGTFAVDSAYPVGPSPSCLFAADLDGDDDVDLATGMLLSEDLYVLFNNGDGTFAPCSIYPVDDTVWSVFAADLDADGDIDLVTGNYVDKVSILFNNGDGTFAPHSDIVLGYHSTSVFAADLDGDGDLDLATANAVADLVTVLSNNGDGTFVLDSTYESENGPYSIFAADFDDDGDLDLATTMAFSGALWILLNNGDGTFVSNSFYPVGIEPYSVFAADFDGDNDLDVVTADCWYYWTGYVSLILNNGDGTFAPASSLLVDVCPTSVFAADLDDDGDLDLMTANRGGGTVSVLLNITPGDCNDDGEVSPGDVVFLLNYLYRNGTAPNPHEVGDVNSDGVVSAGDVVYLLNYLFRNGPPPGCCVVPSPLWGEGQDEG